MDSVFASNYQIMDVEHDGGFRSDVEVGPYLSLFKGVLWYSGLRHRDSGANPGNDAVMARNLLLADRGNGLRSYLAGGGRMVICAQNAVGDSSGLSNTFQREVLGITGFYRLQDLTSTDPYYIHGNITLDANTLIFTDIAGHPDSLRTTFTMTNIDFLIHESDVTPVYYVPAGYLARTFPDSTGFVITPDDQKAAPAAMGILSERIGRIAVTSILPSKTRPTADRSRVTAALLRRVLTD
jgi:hypothetical protein